MSLPTYYRCALLLPLVVPAAAMLTGQRSALLVYLVGSLIIAGVPYVVFAIGFLLWSRGRTGEELARAVWLTPILFALVLMAALAVYLAATGGGVERWSALSTMGGVAMVFGYVYVLLAEAVRLLLFRRSRDGGVAAG